MTDPCSIALLESALAGNLPKQDEASLHQHLEECEECSAAMEQMAGGPAWCQEAASLLAEDELDVAVPTREEWSDVDFTVEHLEPANEPNVLGRLGGYDVLDIIGRGGMGVVLKGFDRELKRCVAIKVLAPHLAQSSLARKRFAREAQAAAAVVHPHVLAIHQVQPGGRLPFLVMPLVAGESLAERLTAQGTLELKEILRIGMQAAAGLAAAHEQGLVHRDVKPANILLEKGVERAVLTDFGLACAADDVTLTRWGIIAGTPQYMSPEPARGEPLDDRSDLFSLGCVLYEMATGVSPFRADSVMATMRRLIDDAPQAMASLNPELPPWFIALVERLLEKVPSRRFNSAKEVSELLEGCLAHVQQPASVPLPAGLPAPAVRRGWRSILGIKGVLAMIGTLGIGLLGVMLLSANPPDIAGEWKGEDWGTVELKKISDAEYAGTYSETVRKQTSLSVTGSGAGSSGSAGLSSSTTSSTAGEIHLKWSRIERRFNGTWREGEDRFGELSVRLDGDEIRGALTTDVKSRINPATPRLADLTWRRVTPNLNTNTLNVTGVFTSSTSSAAIGSTNDRADRFLSVVGTMSPPEHMKDISASIDGRFGEVLVAPGHQVTAGTAIIRIVRPDLQEQVDSNQDLVKQLQARLATIQASPRQPAKEAVDIAKAEFTKAQALAEFARAEATRFATLKDAKAPITQTEIDNAHAILVARQADETIAKARLDALVEQPKLHQEEMDETEKRLQVAKAQLADCREMLDSCTVRAPMDGVVIRLDAVPGQLAQRGSGPICQVAELHEIEIRATIAADDASQIDLGKDVDVQFDHQGTLVCWSGRIISPDPNNVGNPVVVRVANPDWRLYRPGGQVTLRFKLRAATPGGTGVGTGANSGGLAAINNGFVAADLNTGNTAIVGQPVTVDGQPKPGASPAAILEALNAQLREAELNVQDQMANLQVAATVVLRAEANLNRRKEEWEEIDHGYHQLLEKYEQKLVDKRVVDESTVRWKAAQAAEQAARADFKAAHAQSIAAADQLNQARQIKARLARLVELQAARQVPAGAGSAVSQPGAADANHGAPPGATLLEVLFSSPASSLENLRKILTLQGALTDSRREKAQELLDRLLALFVEEEQLRKRFHSDHPQVEELRARMVSVVKEALDLSGVDTSRLKEFADFQAAAEATRLAKEERARLDVAPAPRDLTGFRQHVGQSYLFLVPAQLDYSLRVDHGKVVAEYPGQVWGSDIYTDDSSLATAAVHAGLLLPGMQVVLRVTILPGQESYEGSTRHGVTSSSYGAWGGSYRIEKPMAADIRRINAAEQPKPVRHTLSQLPTKREVPQVEDFTGRVEQVNPVSKSIAFRFDMDERSYRRYRKLLAAGKIKDSDQLLAMGLSDEEGFPHASQIVHIDDKFDPKIGAIGVYGVAQDPDGLLLPGMSVRVRMTLGPPSSVLEVPVNVVFSESQGQTYVWVVNDQHIVERRFVRRGAWDAGRQTSIIEEGLSPQDMVVVKGTEGLKPGDNIGPPLADKETSKSDRNETSAAPPAQMPVPTVLGPKAFRDGDVIEITEVQATSPKLEQGDSITVRGRLRLASEDQAQLALYLTQTEGDGREEVDLSQTIQVKRGRSQFELKTTIKHRGVLHITLYDPSGKPFGGVYFGTAPQMKQIESWSLDYYSPGKAPQKGPAPAEKEPLKPAGSVGALTPTQVERQGDSRARHTISQHPVPREVAPFEDFDGRLVNMDQLLAARAPEKSIAVRFDMDEHSYVRYGEWIHKGGSSFVARLSDEEGFPRAGTLALVSDELDPDTGAFRVYGFLPNPDELLLPGKDVLVRMTLGPQRSALEVPVEAVHWEQDQAYVWVVNERGIVERRFVRKGQTDKDGRMWIVEEGLTPEDRVVIVGTEGLKPGDNIGPPPAEPPQRSTQAAESPPKTTSATPGRVNYFTTGHSIKIACSADGQRIAVANGNPTCIMLVGGTSRVKGNWKPTADILDVETGKIVVSLKLTTPDEDTVLAATEGISHIEATALAFSPAGNVVAVGTSVGQVKLFNARTGELVRSLDDEPAKLADKKAPENWRSLRRAIGSVASLAFSPDGSLLAMSGGSFDDFPGVLDGVTRLTLLTTGPGRLKVWEVKTGTLKQDLVGYSYANTVAFSPDGNLLASAGSWLSSGGRDNGAGVIIWNPQTGAKIRTITSEANAGADAVAFSPNSKMVLFGSEPYDKENGGYTRAVSLADALSGITQWQHQVPSGANPKGFSPDGKSVLVLCGQSIQFLDAATGTVKREIKSTDLSKEGRWDDFVVAPQGPWLVIGAVDEEEGSVELREFDGLGAAANSAPEKQTVAIARAELEKAHAAVELARKNAARQAELEQAKAVGKDLVAEADEKIVQARLDSALEQSGREEKNAKDGKLDAPSAAPAGT